MSIQRFRTTGGTERIICDDEGAFVSYVDSAAELAAEKARTAAIAGDLALTELARDEMKARADRAEALAYVPGRWRCAKCGLVLTSSVMSALDGGMSANTAPHTCDNCSTPMWRVTEREERKEAQQSFCDQFNKLKAAETLLSAAMHTLRSYQYGNGALGPAQEMADRIEAALSPSAPSAEVAK